MKRILAMGLAGVLFGLLLVGVGACLGEVTLQGGKYTVAMEECNRTGKNLCESIACENHTRAAAGRLPRTVPPHCKSNAGIGLDAASESGIRDAESEQ